jgi:hypothetical protein
VQTARRCINSGIPLDFLEIRPTSKIPENSKTFNDHESQCTPKLEEWLSQGKIQKWVDGPFKDEQPQGYVPLHAVVKPEKTRVVAGAHKEINPILPHYPFKMSNITTIEDIVAYDCLLFKLDISDCFMSWTMDPQAQRHLAFRWRGEIYYFVCMPFGLSCAPYFNDLMMRVICTQIAKHGIRHCNYVDDFILARLAGERDRREDEIVKEIFRSLGINNNNKKQSKAWSTREVFLGFALDSTAGTTRCTKEKRAKLLVTVKTMRHQKSTTIEDLMTFTGRLVHVSTCFPYSKLFYLSLFTVQCRFRRARNKSRARVRLQFEALKDLEIWEDILTTRNGTRLWYDLPRREVQVTSDASMQGYGFYVSNVTEQDELGLTPCLQQTGGYAASYLPEHDCDSKKGAIAWGEMIAMVHAFVIMAPQFSNQRMVFETDNLGNVDALNHEKAANVYIRHAFRIMFMIAAKLNIDIRSIHIKGEENVFADWLSRPDLHNYDTIYTHGDFTSNVTHINSSDLQRLLERNTHLETFGLNQLLPNYLC